MIVTLTQSTAELSRIAKSLWLLQKERWYDDNVRQWKKSREQTGVECCNEDFAVLKLRLRLQSCSGYSQPGGVQ